MRFKKIISAIAGLSVSATLFAGTAVVADAAEPITWDFTTWGTIALNEQADYTYKKDGITVVGSDSENDVIDSRGIHWNGRVGVQNQRYVAYTPEVDGTMSITAIAAYRNADIAWTTGDVVVQENNHDVNGGTILFSYMSTSETSTETLSMEAGTTYKIFPSYTGSEIRSMTFTPDSEPAKATVAYDYSKQFTDEEGYTGNATAVTFTVTSEKTTETINVGYGDDTRTLNTQITDGKALCGIIVKDAITVNADNFSDIFTITID